MNLNRKGKRGKRGQGPNPKHPWDQQKGETKTAWTAFLIYRDMEGTRAVSRMTDELIVGQKRTYHCLTHWSKKYQWSKRAAAWDQYLQHKKDKKEIDARMEMSKRHAAYARDMVEVLLHPMKELKRRMMSGNMNLKENLTGKQTKDLFRMLRDVGQVLPKIAELERLARGDVSARMEVIGRDEQLMNNKIMEEMIRSDKRLHDAWTAFQEVVELVRAEEQAKRDAAAKGD